MSALLDRRLLFVIAGFHQRVDAQRAAFVGIHKGVAALLHGVEDGGDRFFRTRSRGSGGKGVAVPRFDRCADALRYDRGDGIGARQRAASTSAIGST